MAPSSDTIDRPTSVPARAEGAAPVGERIARLNAWLLKEVPRLSPDAFYPAFADELVRAGVPVDRIFTYVESAHSTYTGFARTWERGNTTRLQRLPYGQSDTDIYKMSPFATVAETGRWLNIRLATMPDSFYNVVPDLRAAGYRHYLCIPIRFADGRANGLALATRDETGFTPERRAILEAMLPVFSVLLELKVERWRLDGTLRTYVGRTPARKILAGTVRRGEVSRIEAAIMFADLRDFTLRTADMPPEDTVELLDRFFDCIVPTVREEGGEILKFTGDGLLATFAVDPDRPDGRAGVDNDETGSSSTPGGAARGALRAARMSLDCVRALDMDGQPPLDAGFALHFGEAAYGNVGAEDRLDFTVVGRDVNLCSRIARLNRPLGEPILMSDDFRRCGVTEAATCGAHVVAGIPEPITVFKPR